MKKTDSLRATRWGRAAAAVLLAVAAVVPAALAVPAAADEVQVGDSVWVGPAQGYSGASFHPVYSPIPADTSNPGTPALWAYCIEQPISARPNAVATVGDYSSYLGSNYFTDPAVQAKVYWVLTHSYPAVSLDDLAADAGLPSLTLDEATMATQYAIWRYTDLGFDAEWRPWVDEPVTWANARTLYWHLLDGANADTATAPPASADVEVSVSSPTSPGTTGSVYGPFVVSTNQATVSVSSSPALPITDASGTPIDTAAVVNGQELYLDLTSTTTAGSATITATANGASGTGFVITTPRTVGGTATPASHAQSLVLVAAEGATTTASASGNWAAAVVPAIGTTLVDSADQDHNLVWNGGTVVDTIAYTGLTPGQQYTVSGELMLQADGTGTGITGTTTFTPTASDGTVDVTFTVPTGYAGDALVAFEYLYEGTNLSTPVAQHADIADAAQTVTVDEQPAVPTLGTSLVDSADQDHNLVWNGGTVIDTIAY
ncbi:VaFE repeat-containing surface-anchored protein, partial [Microbacterium sp. ZW T5_45]|uniref:VaFE repeat-containing surface-anchored protein n=1 Tax=Microbacterium sp. ZW T5_45 TaxID=3378080 RepID=UPI003854A3A5